MGLGLWDAKEFEEKNTKKMEDERERESVCVYVVFIAQHLSPKESFQNQRLFNFKMNTLY